MPSQTSVEQSPATCAGRGMPLAVGVVAHTPAEQAPGAQKLEGHALASKHSAQAPPTQYGVWPVHEVDVMKVPFASHVCTSVPLHCVVPGWHVPQLPIPSHTLAPLQAVPCGWLA